MTNRPPIPWRKKPGAPITCSCLLKSCTRCNTKEEVDAHWKKLAEGVNERMKAVQKSEEDRRNTPPKCDVGVCVHCSGKVTGEYIKEATRDAFSMPIGPASRSFYAWRFKGYHCESCGLMYKFVPKPKDEQGKTY